MKKFLSIYVFIAVIINAVVNCAIPLKAQTVSDFENLSLPVDTFWNGADYTGIFISGNAEFPNLYLYDSLYGGYWASGWAYSTMRNDSTPGFGNIYSSFTGSGSGASLTYGVGQQGALLRLSGNAEGKVVNGFMVTNNTYAGLSMLNGDAFAKKFGGISGQDPDWFLLSVTGFLGGVPITDTVEYYLADYRFGDNQLDYVLDYWDWVDLTSLGDMDSLVFILTSSDTGMFGMNTPPFFCVDSLVTADSHASIYELSGSRLNIYPNPANKVVWINSGKINSARINIYSVDGRLLMFEDAIKNDLQSINVSKLCEGTYILELISGNSRNCSNFIICR